MKGLNRWQTEGVTKTVTPPQILVVKQFLIQFADTGQGGGPFWTPPPIPLFRTKQFCNVSLWYIRGLLKLLPPVRASS